MERILQTTAADQNQFIKSNISQIISKNSFTLLMLAIMALFFSFHYIMGGLWLIHFLFCVAILVLYFLHPKTRLFFVLAITFIIKEMIYDSFRYVPFEWLTPIRVIEPYAIDEFIFGISMDGGVVLFHEYLLKYAHPILDFIAGGIYHIFIPTIYIYPLLFWKLKSFEFAERYACAFLLINIFAFATYLLYPAAAPWYVAEYGFNQPLSPIVGSAAGLANFDKIFGIAVSNEIYSANPVVFGAIPSMHVGFTMLAWFYSFKVNKKLCVIAGTYAFLVIFSAIYLQHHYMIDVVLGIIYALIAFILIEKYLKSTVQKGYLYLFRLLKDHGGRTLLKGK